MPLKVLVVDDERLIVETLSEVLVWDGHEVSSAATGEQALERLTTQPLPDLLIIDFMMPLLDGVAAIRHLRSRPETAALPIILMTAAPTSVEGPALYDALLVKPFNIKSLRAAIQLVVDRRKPGAPAGA